jgi:hypothetical protein
MRSDGEIIVKSEITRAMLHSKKRLSRVRFMFTIAKA